MPVGKFFGNTPRENAAGSNLLNLFEESNWIDLRKNKEAPQSLFDHFVFLFQKHFADHRERMRNSYGYERPRLASWSGKSEEGMGGTQQIFEYCSINGKTTKRCKKVNNQCL